MIILVLFNFKLFVIYCYKHMIINYKYIVIIYILEMSKTNTVERKNDYYI